MFKKSVCDICKNKFMVGKFKTKDNHIVCNTCMVGAGILDVDHSNIENFKLLSLSQIEDEINKRGKNVEDIKSFVATKKIGSFVEFNHDEQKWIILSSWGTRKKATLYNFSDIHDFELIQDGESISSGGLGRALVGGVAFGGTGAIIGGITGKKKTSGVCTTLKIKVTMRNSNKSAIYINFITTPTKKKGFMYKNAFESAQECLSTFQLICDELSVAEKANSATLSLSIPEEILKYKDLLDKEIITPEEFDKKKKELLS